jgi:hypothetical protein
MADINVAALLAQKKIEMEEARRSVRPITEAIDERGQVRIWMIAEKRWIKRWPVDAVEILKSGTANLTGPEEEIEQQQTQEPEPQIKQPSEPIETKHIMVAIESMTIPELKEYARVKEIDISKLTRKADIINSIKNQE